MGQWANYLTKGIDLKGAAAPSRKEIRDLSSIELILLREGLAKFQNEKRADDPKSWFQVAGIHGLPYTTWPNQAWNNDIPRKPGTKRIDGFCTHSSIIFLTWHRPYLSLFETILFDHVQDFVIGIDNSHPEKSRYVEAAKSFRLPYWDWARRGQSAIFPQVAIDNRYDRASVPRSTKSWFNDNPVYNPLFRYPFPNGVDGRITRGSATTERYPDSQDAKGEIEAALLDFYTRKRSRSGESKNLSERTAYILLAYKRYVSMSNNAYVDDKDSSGRPVRPEVWGSLEDTHNSVHGLTGGGGHMGDPTVAAFDPIFWLHHANIDRLFAIWQALHEKDTDVDAWVTTRSTSDGSWTQVSGDLEGVDTKLYPFRPTEESWYDSKINSGVTSIRRTEPFGYTYPETAGLKYPPTADAKSKLFNTVQSYYTNLPRMIRQSRANDETAGDFLLPQATILSQIAETKVTANHAKALELVSNLPKQEELLEKSIGPDKPFLRDLAPDNEYLEWLFNVKAQRHAVGGKYTVHVFLDAVEEDNVALWPMSPHYVGSFSPFGQASDTMCENCKDQQEAHLEITGQIPLTIALVERFIAQLIPDLREETVVPYLAKNLHWRVEIGGQAVANRAQVDGLTVFVVSNKVTVPEDESQPPVYAEGVSIHAEVTTKPSGEGRGEGTGLTVGQ